MNTPPPKKTVQNDRTLLKRYAWLSIAAAVTTIFIKGAAYYLTGSVGLLSDAMESIVNLAGAVMALAMLIIAARPADYDHAYGHSKAEYFSSAFEAVLIIIAAALIGYAAVERLFNPQPLQKIGLGLIVSLGATLINLVVSIILSRAGKRYDSITLEADAKHLMTDVLTSAGVIIGVGAVAVTGWQMFDPVVALAVTLNIVWTGIRIIMNSISGLMDSSLPENEQKIITSILESYQARGIQYHALRTRKSGSRRFVTIHVLVPGDWTVGAGHHLLESIEDDICRSLKNTSVITHLESLDDPASWNDKDLDRETSSKQDAHSDKDSPEK
jgi:cation diffusion facilitator family transporter